jgi:hypothetical protein
MPGYDNRFISPACDPCVYEYQFLGQRRNGQLRPRLNHGRRSFKAARCIQKSAVFSDPVKGLAFRRSTGLDSENGICRPSFVKFGARNNVSFQRA